MTTSDIVMWFRCYVCLALRIHALNSIWMALEHVVLMSGILKSAQGVFGIVLDALDKEIRV